MIRYTNWQLATVIAIPIVSVLLVWTVAIFHKNRSKWGPHDIPVVSLLVLSVVRNLCVLGYVLTVTLNEEVFDVEYCGIVVWLFNSIHTFQASVLTTIAVIGLFSSRLHRKRQNLRQFLTTTHIVYHLFCLTTLCACVGVAAILANNNDSKSTIFRNITLFNNNNPCTFFPYDLDMKFNIFILVLHISLAVISFVSLILICYYHLRSKTNTSFDYLKKSNSDLSDFSLGENKNYFDTYTVVQKTDDSLYAIQTTSGQRHNLAWNSDMSNISTTVSSTNSKRPCISKKQYETIEDWNRTGLETIHPVLIVSYLFYHLPVIVLSVYPKLIYPHSVAGFTLWLGLLQDLLIPIGLGIVDSRFCKWVANVYRCTARRTEDKLPHIGLDGKFRPFGSSQPQSLDVSNHHDQQSARPVRSFPAATGNLYSSIEPTNRLPIVQPNYRRPVREVPRESKSASNMSLHQKSHLQRQDYVSVGKCMNCEANLCPSHSDLHHLSQLSYLQKGTGDLERRLSRSHENVHHHQLRISQQDITVHSRPVTVDSSDEEYLSDLEASSSCNSITTEANCDFDFFNVASPETTNANEQEDYFSITTHPIMSTFKPHEYKAMLEKSKNLKITRSNSKRSLENFQTFIETDIDNLKRSSSYLTLEDRKKCNFKNKSVECIPPYVKTTVDVDKAVGSVPDFKKVFISEYI